MSKPGEIVFEEEYDDDENLIEEYCVIIGRNVLGGCQVEICGDIACCPYISHETHGNKEEEKS